MPNVAYPSPLVTAGNGPNARGASRYQVVKHPAAPKRLPYAIKDSATGGFVTGASPHFPRVFPTKAEAKAAIPRPDPTNGWGDTYARTVHDRNLYSNELARFRQKYPGHADDPNLAARIRMYDQRIAHMNSVSPSGSLRANIAAAGGVPNRRPHGPITKAAPDRFYSGLADVAGAGANLTGDVDDVTWGALANAINGKFHPAWPKAQFNTEPYYEYDKPVGFRASVRDLPRALSTAGIDLYNHPIGTLLEQLQYLDPNMAGAGAAEAWGDVEATRSRGILPSSAAKGPVQEHEVTTYGDFDDRSVPGDDIEGHELWQHANIKARGLATERLSTPASQNNPVIGLNSRVHRQVTAVQRGLDAANQTPTENINANAAILRNLSAADRGKIAKLHRMAIDHAKRHGYHK